MFSIFMPPMAVEMEEIELFGLFKLNGRSIQILEHHLTDLSRTAAELTPIKIEYQNLQLLGFLRHSNGIYYREQGDIALQLRCLKNGQWELYILDNRIRLVSFLHQLQRVWYALFDDHLYLPKNHKKSQAKGNQKSGSFRSRY